MNFNVTNVIMFMAGALLLYSGIKGVMPKDVIVAAFEGKTVASPPPAAPAPSAPVPAPISPVNPVNPVPPISYYPSV